MQWGSRHIRGPSGAILYLNYLIKHYFIRSLASPSPEVFSWLPKERAPGAPRGRLPRALLRQNTKDGV